MILKTKYGIDDNVVFNTKSTGKDLTGWVYHVKVQVFKVDKNKGGGYNHSIVIYYQIKDNQGRIWIALEEDIKGLRRELL
jgi:hypothetical protein